MIDPNDIAEVIASEVRKNIEGALDNMFVRGTIQAVNTDGTCTLRIEGSTTDLTNIPSIGSYLPVVNDIVIVLSMGRSSQNLVVVGGTQGALNSIVRGETPTGLINGTNKVFTTTSDYVTGSLAVYRNGIRLKDGGDDFVDDGGGFTMETAPSTGARLLVDYAVATSEIISGHASIVSAEAPTGDIDDSNKVFDVGQGKYAPGSLQVYLNGLLQVPVTHYTESDPATGEFTFIDSPETGDNILCSYHVAQTGTGNADMLDGKHAADFVTVSGVQTLNDKTLSVEDWHRVGDAGEPTYQNGWVDYSTYPGTYAPAKFMKDGAGMVHLAGMVKNGTDGTVIFTLPVGYRPAFRQIYMIQSGSVAGRLDVVANGDVSPNADTNPSWISLDGITFMAEQ